MGDGHTYVTQAVLLLLPLLSMVDLSPISTNPMVDLSTNQMLDLSPISTKQVVDPIYDGHSR